MGMPRDLSGMSEPCTEMHVKRIMKNIFDDPDTEVRARRKNKSAKRENKLKRGW